MAFPSPAPLTDRSQYILGIGSLLLVAFAQPAWLVWLTPIAALGGYALFWRLLLSYTSPKKRFWLGTAWFLGIQLIQLSWFTSHPYGYIYAVYISLALWLGLEFGILSLFIVPRMLGRLSYMLALAGLWTFFEWSRIWVFSGFSWNPLGLALSANIYSLQLASLAGIFGLSFWVMVVNLLALRALVAFEVKFKGWTKYVYGWLALAAFPYLFGWAHIAYQEHRLCQQPQENPNFRAVLVQTAFPPEEMQAHSDKNPIEMVVEEWQQILNATKNVSGQSFDLLVLPEIVVPFGTYAFAFPLHDVQKAFYEILGPESVRSLPTVRSPFAAFQNNPLGPEIMVNNAFWVQGLANYFKAGVVIGLEDAEGASREERKYYSSAFLFPPLSAEDEGFSFPERYDKRILLPMGEYIPFEFCRQMAARYNVCGSFTHGTEAKVMHYNGLAFSPSICYEETFSDITHESRVKGANLLVNLTSDVWYPNSKLTKQHFDLARLRTVENGVPLIRACNTGITGAIDSLGNVISLLGGDKPEESEWVREAFLVEVPKYHYWTLYSVFGDKLILGISLLLILWGLTTHFISYKK